jgi:hypothetical protein
MFSASMSFSRVIFGTEDRMTMDPPPRLWFASAICWMIERSISPCGRGWGQREGVEGFDLAEDEGVVGDDNATLPFTKLVDKFTEILGDDADDEGEDDHATDGHHEADDSLHESCVVRMSAWVSKKGPRDPKGLSQLISNEHLPEEPPDEDEEDDDADEHKRLEPPIIGPVEVHTIHQIFQITDLLLCRLMFE